MSLISSGRMDSDSEGRLAEYANMNTGKFKEDGTFIRQCAMDQIQIPPKEPEDEGSKV